MTNGPASNPSTGSQIGRYRLLEKIGAGGMGDVFRAEDTTLGRVVAMKILPKELAATPDRIARFEIEARAVAQLSHPNLVALFDVGHIGGGGKGNDIPYLVYEFVDGETLEQRLLRGPVAPRTAARWVKEAASGLASAHDAGILHRDIKPANLILSKDGRLRILDFGLAKIEETGGKPLTGLTGVGLVVGTAQYMSPEQAMGQTVDNRSDIFSLGLVFYEMLAGKKPFAGESAIDTMHAIIRTDHPPLDPKVVPGALVEIAEMALKKRPEARLSSMQDFEAALDKALREMDTDEVLATRSRPRAEGPATPATAIRAASNMDTTALPVARRWPRRGRWLAGVASLAVAATVLVVAVRGTKRRAPSIVLPSRAPVQLTTSTTLDVYPSFSPDGNSMVYSSDRGGGLEIYRKPLTTGSAEIPLTSDGQQNIQAAWAPSGEVIAYHSKQRGGVWLIPALGGVPKELTTFGSRPTWSPDSKWICFQGDTAFDLSAAAFGALPPSALWLVPAAGGEPRRLTEPGMPAGGHGSPSWSPDGKRIAFSSYDRRVAEIWTVSAAGGDAVRVAYGPGMRYDPVYARDGKSLYYCATTPSYSYVLSRVAITSSGKPDGEAQEIINLGPGPITQLALTSDGKKLAYAGLTVSSNLWSLPVSPKTGEPTGPAVPLTKEIGRNTRPAFSPDGSKIAFTKWRTGTKQDIYVMDADGRNATQRTTSPEDEDFATWLPGERLGFMTRRTGHQTFFLQDLATSREELLLDAGPQVDFFRLSPDGKRIVFNSTRAGTLNLWAMDVGGKEPRQLTFDKELLGFATWSPDSKWLAVEMRRGEDIHMGVLPSAGGSVEQLTSEPGQSWPYSFSPDGDKIAFSALRKNLWNVWWVSRADRSQKQLTRVDKLNAYVRYPAWSPKGDQIVYEYAEVLGNIWIYEGK